MTPLGPPARRSGSMNTRPPRPPGSGPATPTGHPVGTRPVEAADSRAWRFDAAGRSAIGRDLSPTLRLVRPPEDEATPRAAASPTLHSPDVEMETTDPRWVLAVRTGQCLQGSVLAPEQRDRLLILARLMGLTPFDANLIIAIVQDQARRGLAAEYCAAAGRRQLAMIPRPRKPGRFHGRRSGRRSGFEIAGWIVVLLTLELLVLAWWFSH